MYAGVQIDTNRDGPPVQANARQEKAPIALFAGIVWLQFAPRSLRGISLPG